MANDKSPIVNKEEAEMLFKSRLNRPTLDSNDDSEDKSYMNYKMIDPNDKSSIILNTKRSGSKLYEEEWTTDIPKIMSWNSDTSSDNDN